MNKIVSDINGCPQTVRIKYSIIDFGFTVVFLIIHLATWLVIFSPILKQLEEYFAVISFIFIFVSVFVVAEIHGLMFKEGSLGRKITKTELIDLKTGKKPNFFKVMLMNIVGYKFKEWFFHTRLDRRLLWEIILGCVTTEKETRTRDEDELS
ncbi:MAG: hypothetical protein IJ309_03765 [Clostridia bacterium]|nr:hypothetical protein [Clostridia bacterium]